jgi:hypothetical protein
MWLRPSRWVAARAALLVPVGWAMAQDMQNADEFHLADTDGNACVSWEELRNRGLVVFHALDANGDGLVIGSEQPGAARATGEAVEPPAVDLASFQDELRRSFSLADQNADGCLSSSK